MSIAQPTLTSAGLAPSHMVMAVDESGAHQSLKVASEAPLTLYVDRHEIATLLTLGSHPEALSLGYLRNRGLVSELGEINSIQVDWEVETAAVKTHSGLKALAEETTTAGSKTDCGRGTVFGKRMDELSRVKLPPTTLHQSTLCILLEKLAPYADACWKTGAVHGCALCADTQVLRFVEDVSQHNVVDTIAGMMWLEGMEAANKIFYTTGCLTSEMVMKVALMGFSILISRTGVTEMGVSLARKAGMLLIARAKGQQFQVFNGETRLIGDVISERRVAAL